LSAYRVEVSRHASRQLQRLPPNVRSRVVAALRAIADDPNQGVKLLGPVAGSRRYRVWGYRMIFVLLKSVFLVIVENIRHRAGAYRS
jgi:mRNA interferase RelE/StbE